MKDWILLQHDLYSDDPQLEPYKGRPSGDNPELCSLDHCLIKDVHKSVDIHVRLTEMLQSMILERSSIPNAIARGVDAWMKSENALTSGVDNDGVEVDMVTIEIERKRRLKEMEDALYRFFTARVGLRFLRTL